MADYETYLQDGIEMHARQATAEVLLIQANRKLNQALQERKAVRIMYQREEASEEWLLRIEDEVHELILLCVRFALLSGVYFLRGK